MKRIVAVAAKENTMKVGMILRERSTGRSYISHSSVRVIILT